MTSSLNIVPNYNEDPGRFRNIAFLKVVYGNSEINVRNNLVKVKWLPKTLANKPVEMLFNRQNNAAFALQKVSEELDNLPDHLKKYVTDEVSTFNWRVIAGSDRLSPHSFGIAIHNTDS